MLCGRIIENNIWGYRIMWLNYDLHMHCFKSGKTKIGDKDKVKMIPAKELCEIIKEKKIDCFSITDHNTFDGKLYSDKIGRASCRERV